MLFKKVGHSCLGVQSDPCEIAQASRDEGILVCTQRKGKDSHQALAKGVFRVIKQVMDGIENMF